VPKIPDQTPRKLTQKTKARIIERDESKCYCCQVKTDTPHIDHIVPLFLAGTEDDDNLAVICPECHKGKNKTEAKVRGKIRRLSGMNKTRKKKKIQSRGFDRRFKKKLDGSVVKR